MSEALEVEKDNPKKRKTNLDRHVKKLKKSTVPTMKELEELKEAESIFHSGLFKMEVEELLKEVKPEISVQKVNEWLLQLENFLFNMAEVFQVSIEDYCANAQIPILKHIKTDKGMFKFIPPVKITKVGSFAHETICHSHPVLDVALEIPKPCWQAMDYLNGRYHMKRLLYLVHITECLQKSDIVESLQFQYEDDCYMKPNLLIIPKDIQVTICLIPYPSEDAFKLTRFVPARNNVRSSWLLNTENNDLDVPTPYYNSSILRDIVLPKLQNFIAGCITSENIKRGIILVKIWCIQRGLMSGYGRLNGFIITMFVAYLLKKQRINLFMNSYQVFRCTLLAFQFENFSEGISLAFETGNKPPMDDFKNTFHAILLEETGFLNVLYCVNKETVDVVKHEAKLGLAILDSDFPNSFSLLFMNKISVLEKFEYLIHLKGPKKFRKYFKKLCDEKECLNYGENKIVSVVPKVCDILRQGLNKRILLLDIIKNSPSPWPVGDCPPSPNCGLLTIGLLLNPDVPISNLEKGPLADDPQAEEFREFWGERSEMRRFQDGSIREAVYWPANTIEDKRKVFSHIVKDILKRHLNTKEEDITVTGTEVDCILHLPQDVLSSDFSSYGTGEEAHATIMQTFNSLSKQLRNLNGLPLLISSIQGISPAFHFSDVFPPLSVSYSSDESTYLDSESKKYLKLKRNALAVPPFVPALKVIISFEGSGKWPDDVEAIKRVKTAFLIKIAQLITSKYSLVAVPFPTYLDIIKDGLVFRLEIACHKELFLLKQIKMPNGMIKSRETDETRFLQLHTEILPKLNSVFHGLHQQHNTFGTACRLAKRWISSQLKFGYIHETAIELLVAHCYCHPEPYSCPSSPQVAFFRFLSLIVNHDWKTCPLIVNLNNELQDNDYEEIYSVFTSQRSTLPPMVISMPFDKRGSLFTKNKPHALILKRIIILAKASLDTLHNKLYSMKDFDIKVICRPPLDSYDMIIYLNRNAVPRMRCALDIPDSVIFSSMKPYKDQILYPVVEYDPPLKYLEELRANFDKFAFFFYDVYGADFIAVVWKKSALDKEFKAAGFSFIDAVMEDLKIMGRGLVQKIDICNNNVHKNS